MAKKTKILFLSSNAPLPDQPSSEIPSNKTYDAIKQVVEKHGNQFELIPEFSPTADTLSELLLRYSPHIVHFFGHSETGGLYFENEDGTLEETKKDPFANLFRRVNEQQMKSSKEKIKLVILVACNSDRIAQSISENVECAIGIHNRMPVAAGIAFSRSFYAHLVEGRDVQCAFDLASLATQLRNLNKTEKPKIFPENGHFNELVFLPPRGKETPSPPPKLFPLKYTFKDFPEPFISKDNNLDFIIALPANQLDYVEYTSKKLSKKSLREGRGGDLNHLPKLVADFSFCAAKRKYKAQEDLSNLSDYPFARESFLLSDNEKMQNIISIGSGMVNQITRDMLVKYRDSLPAKFDRPEGSDCLIFNNGVDEKVFDRRGFDKNVGFIEMVPNPYNKDKVVLIVAGLLNAGTQAAILALCDGIKKEQLSNQIVKIKGEDTSFPVQLVKSSKTDSRQGQGNDIITDFAFV